MAFGVLTAYAICRAAFAILRAHARSINPAMTKVPSRQIARLT